jgi:glycosyltransferase involved in cell wall biosynthesis
MKNILYIGPYKQTNGIGKSCKRMVDSLVTNSDINLAIRPVFYTSSKYYDALDNTYTEFEENSFKHYDIVVQHGLPDMFEYNRKFGKNIGIVEIETRKLSHSGWIEKINLMDEVIVNSVFSANSLLDSGVDIPVNILPEGYNLNRYNAQYTSIFTYNTDKKPFIFYTIGKYTEKKNIQGIILAYLLEFEENDNVRLFIKTDDESENHEVLKELIEFDIERIKKSIRKDHIKIPDIDVVCGNISDTDIIRMHKNADCYVNTVRGDSFGPCAVEAALCDRLVINTKHIGSATYFNTTNALMVDAQVTNVFTPYFYNRNTFTIYEEWYEPNITSIRQAMRTAFEMSDEDRSKLTSNIDKSIFDNSRIGSTLL